MWPGILRNSQKYRAYDTVQIKLYMPSSNKRQISHVPNLIRELNACETATSESIKFDDFKLKATFLNLWLKQPKIRLRFDILIQTSHFTRAKYNALIKINYYPYWKTSCLRAWEYLQQKELSSAPLYPYLSILDD